MTCTDLALHEIKIAIEKLLKQEWDFENQKNDITQSILTEITPTLKRFQRVIIQSMEQKGTAGEWSLQKVGRFFDLRISDNYTIRTEDDITAALYKDIVSAHNAAIAAEREKLNAVILAEHKLRLRTEQQLDREREKRRKEMETITMNTSDIETVQQLRSQLDAERKSSRQALDMEARVEEELHQKLADKEGQIHALKQLLGTERERCKAGGWLSQEALDAYAETEAQLAAAVDALEYVRPFFENGCNVSQALNKIDAALAKLKESK